MKELWPSEISTHDVQHTKLISNSSSDGSNIPVKTNISLWEFRWYQINLMESTFKPECAMQGDMTCMWALKSQSSWIFCIKKHVFQCMYIVSAKAVYWEVKI